MLIKSLVHTTITGWRIKERIFPEFWVLILDFLPTGKKYLSLFLVDPSDSFALGYNVEFVMCPVEFPFFLVQRIFIGEGHCFALKCFRPSQGYLRGISGPLLGKSCPAYTAGRRPPWQLLCWRFLSELYRSSPTSGILCTDSWKAFLTSPSWIESIFWWKNSNCD